MNPITGEMPILSAEKERNVRLELAPIRRNKTFMLKKNSALRQPNTNSGRFVRSGAPLSKIGLQMNKLFKDECVYEHGLIENPNFKLKSLRDYSAMDMNLLAAVRHDSQNDKELQSSEKIRYMSDASLYD